MCQCCFYISTENWKKRGRQLGVAVIARPPRHQCGEVDHLVPSHFAMHVGSDSGNRDDPSYWVFVLFTTTKPSRR
ncbi:unnamed protein product [Thlaspi arvense]|uniref:Uncharacterized protein n=1 Tax=Thlaspi arvense TaxID=13288 RepID=A0AAU9RK11_THLAR|nr:unnamed protein product [Thlaspi arvense]